MTYCFQFIRNWNVRAEILLIVCFKSSGQFESFAVDDQFYDQLEDPPHQW